MITNEEIRLITGVSDTDARINYWKNIALELFYQEIGVQTLEEHTVTLEDCKIYHPTYIRVQEFPVSNVQLYQYPRSHVEITSYTFRADQKDDRKLWILNSSGEQTEIIWDRVFVTYSAGYQIQGTIEVAVNPSNGETMTVESLGVTTTYTFKNTAVATTDILIGANKEATATNIATKLSGEVEDEFVTLPLGVNAVSEVLEIENANIPYDIKAAIAYIVAGGLGAKAGSGDIASYRIGTKQVNFRSDTEKNFVKSTTNKYASKYKGAYLV